LGKPALGKLTRKLKNIVIQIIDALLINRRDFLFFLALAGGNKGEKPV
jgi:hypothetical protein